MQGDQTAKRPRFVVEEEIESTPDLPLKAEELPAHTTTTDSSEPAPPEPPVVTSFGLVDDKNELDEKEQSATITPSKHEGQDPIVSEKPKVDQANEENMPVQSEEQSASSELKNLNSDTEEEHKEQEDQDTKAPAAAPSVETGILADNPTSDEVKEWLKDIRPDNSKETVKDGGGWGGKIVVILLVLLAFGLLGGGFYYFSNSMKEDGANSMPPSNTNQTAEVTVAPTQVQATPTTAPESVDYSTLSLQILNGSGKPGEAGKAEDLVSDLKFKSTRTGNAPNFNFKETKIEMKSSVSSSAFETLKEKLGKTYEVENSAGTLAASSSYDVVITVGSTLAQ